MHITNLACCNGKSVTSCEDLAMRWHRQPVELQRSSSSDADDIEKGGSRDLNRSESESSNTTTVYSNAALTANTQLLRLETIRNDEARVRLLEDEFSYLCFDSRELSSSVRMQRLMAVVPARAKL
jgi:hypothetical protein